MCDIPSCLTSQIQLLDFLKLHYVSPIYCSVSVVNLYAIPSMLTLIWCTPIHIIQIMKELWWIIAASIVQEKNRKNNIKVKRLNFACSLVHSKGDVFKLVMHVRFDRIYRTMHTLVSCENCCMFPFISESWCS